VSYAVEKLDLKKMFIYSIQGLLSLAEEYIMWLEALMENGISV
jgi:hypothetical protein